MVLASSVINSPKPNLYPTNKRQMASTTWKIVNLVHNTEDGGVITAHWSVSAQEDQYSASSCGTISFTPDPTSTDFIPYADLTEEGVIGWVKTEMGEELVTFYEAKLLANIEEQKTPKVISGLPWAI